MGKDLGSADLEKGLNASELETTEVGLQSLLNPGCV